MRLRGPTAGRATFAIRMRCYLNLKLARTTLLSLSVIMSWRHWPTQALLVFQVYVYWPVVASYRSPLVVSVVVSSTASTGSCGLQLICLDVGELAAKMFRPKLPFRLNLTGIARPALTSFNVGRLSTGWKKPAK